MQIQPETYWDFTVNPQFTVGAEQVYLDFIPYMPSARILEDQHSPPASKEEIMKPQVSQLYLLITRWLLLLKIHYSVVEVVVIKPTHAVLPSTLHFLFVWFRWRDGSKCWIWDDVSSFPGARATGTSYPQPERGFGEGERSPPSSYQFNHTLQILWKICTLNIVTLHTKCFCHWHKAIKKIARWKSVWLSVWVKRMWCTVARRSSVLRRMAQQTWWHHYWVLEGACGCLVPYAMWAEMTDEVQN